MRFDVYGWASKCLGVACRQVEDVLGVKFELHDSSYHGGSYYLWRGNSSEELIIQCNFQDEEGYWYEQENLSQQVLLYASAMSDCDYDLLASMEGVSLLRSRKL